MKVTIDKSKCMSNQMCIAIAPEVFRLGADDLSEVYNLAPELKELILAAANNCTYGAITVEE